MNGQYLIEKLVAYGDFSMESGYRAMREILGRRCRLTALFAGNDTIAIGAMAAIIRASCGARPIFPGNAGQPQPRLCLGQSAVSRHAPEELRGGWKTETRIN